MFIIIYNDYNFIDTRRTSEVCFATELNINALATLNQTAITFHVQTHIHVHINTDSHTCSL